MNRRAFLLLKTKGRERVMELSCERLYMRWSDARSRAGAGVGVADAHEPGWDGEPPSELVTETVDALLGELDRGLAGADALRITDEGWLSDPAFRSELESRVEAFRERGGRVE
jgi:hypothetical protein